MAHPWASYCAQINSENEEDVSLLFSQLLCAPFFQLSSCQAGRRFGVCECHTTSLTSVVSQSVIHISPVCGLVYAPSWLNSVTQVNTRWWPRLVIIGKWAISVSCADPVSLLIDAEKIRQLYTQMSPYFEWNLWRSYFTEEINLVVVDSIGVVTVVYKECSEVLSRPFKMSSNKTDAKEGTVSFALSAWISLYMQSPVLPSNCTMHASAITPFV